jgi:hypothetical protein
MGFLVHHQRTFSYGQYGFWVIAIQCNDAWFIYYYFIVMDNEGIGCTQVYGNLLGKKVE